MFIRANDDHTNSREPDPPLGSSITPPLLSSFARVHFAAIEVGYGSWRFLVKPPTCMLAHLLLRGPLRAYVFLVRCRHTLVRGARRDDESAPARISTRIPRYSLMWLPLIELSHLASSPLPLSLTVQYNGGDAKNYVSYYSTPICLSTIILFQSSHWQVCEKFFHSTKLTNWRVFLSRLRVKFYSYTKK